MRGRHHYAVAARSLDGNIVIKQETLQSRVYTSRFWALPFVRGVAGLIEMIHLGMRALTWSANLQLGEDVEISPRAMRATMGTALAFGLVLFMGLPFLAGRLLHQGATRSTTTIVIEGVARAAILLGYLTLIGLMPSVKRVFEYHGAEHKAINCLEAGDPIDVDHVAASSRLHPRCGTGFLVVVALVSIIVFTPLGGLPTAVRLLLQIALVPVVAAFSYEMIRGLAKVRHTTGGRIALIPILATQRLTTREPNGAQMEVAIAALDAARAGEGGAVSEPTSPLIP